MKKKQTEQVIRERTQYLEAFDDTMVAIWLEKIQKLGIVDTGALRSSVRALPPIIVSERMRFMLTQEFLEYGLYVDAGTGREVYRGNPGDIGRPKVRERKEWFSKKYYASVMNLKEFMAESAGEEFFAVCSAIFDGDAMRSRTSNG